MGLQGTRAALPSPPDLTSPPSWVPGGSPGIEAIKHGSMWPLESDMLGSSLGYLTCLLCDAGQMTKPL